MIDLSLRYKLEDYCITPMKKLNRKYLITFRGKEIVGMKKYQNKKLTWAKRIYFF